MCVLVTLGLLRQTMETKSCWAKQLQFCVSLWFQQSKWWNRLAMIFLLLADSSLLTKAIRSKRWSQFDWKEKNKKKFTIAEKYSRLNDFFLLFVVARDWVFSPLSCDYEVNCSLRRCQTSFYPTTLPLFLRTRVEDQLKLVNNKTGRLFYLRRFDGKQIA